MNKDELAALLREAEKAHAEYEKMLGGKDDDWPAWYADFVVKKMQNASKQTTRPMIEATEEPKSGTGPLDPDVVSGHAPVPPPAANNQSKTALIGEYSTDAKPPAKIDPGTTSMQICPTCGHRNRFGILLCENCGTNLSTGQQTAAGTRDLRDPSPPAATNNDTEEDPGAVATKLETSEEKAVRTAGSTRFDTAMTLRIEVVGGATPIILKPKSNDMILGRRDPTTGATPEVDLTPYAGYRMGVSRKHASLRLQESQLNLWDLGSSNGTFINGTRLNPHRPYPIRDGDEIRLGQMVLRLFFQSGQSNRS